jgi:alanine racemase
MSIPMNSPTDSPKLLLTPDPRLLDERAWVEVDITALLANGRMLLSSAGGAGLLAVIKADAYGLGAVVVAKALAPLAPWGYAVATPEEGLLLRKSGIVTPILVLMPTQLTRRGIYVTGRLHAILEDPDVAASWGLPFHVEIDTGMGRSGIRWDDEKAIRAIATAQPEGVFTHFHSADESPETVELQWLRFCDALTTMGKRPRLLHAANTAGVWRLPEPLDLVRPGIFLYGGHVCADLPAPRPVVSVRSRIVSIRTVPRGETVSYGGEWRAEAETRVATLGAGYADGVPRSIMGRASVLIRGRRYPVIGRVTMDLLMADLGPPGSSPALIGDVATILGTDEGDTITLGEFASWSGTNCYEVLTRLSPRLPRYYIPLQTDSHRRG